MSNYQKLIKCVPLNNQPYRAGPTLVNMNFDEYFFVLSVSVLMSAVEVVTLLTYTEWGGGGGGGGGENFHFT